MPSKVYLCGIGETEVNAVRIRAKDDFESRFMRNWLIALLSFFRSSKANEFVVSICQHFW